MTGEGAASPSCPKSLYYELLDFTFELAKAFNALPFEVFKQDKDEVIMLINYLIEKGDTEEYKTEIKEENKPNPNARIKVNDKTATGGWY